MKKSFWKSKTLWVALGTAVLNHTFVDPEIAGKVTGAIADILPGAMIVLRLITNKSLKLS